MAAAHCARLVRGQYALLREAKSASAPRPREREAALEARRHFQAPVRQIIECQSQRKKGYNPSKSEASQAAALPTRFRD